jgi:cellulose synthase/poly-beta-1,6-N-acetylglucosamine synthase-like glycosyltransferase
VSSELPQVTIIIPTKPGQAEIAAVTAARQLDYPADRLEVIVARGRQPAVQRNTALRAARGELIYFLDDDSRPLPGNLRRAVDAFRRATVKMLGGPNLCPPEAPPLEKVFAVVLSNWLAFGPSRARYAPVGRIRATSEKELILCNLMARREALLELGGFDESLYPNEENALMDELQKRGAELLYDPEFAVHRRPRSSLSAFCRMLMNYGRGRAEQFRTHPTPGSALNFVPPLFCVYLLAAAPLFLWLGSLALAPLAIYALAIVAQTAVSIPTHGFDRALMAMPLLVASHVFYGLGFWRGLCTKLKPPGQKSDVEVTLERAPV